MDKAEILRDLTTDFSSEVVEKAMELLEAEGIDSNREFINVLLDGRNGESRWPRIRKVFQSDLSIRNLQLLYHYVDNKELESLLEEASLDFEQIIEYICSMGFINLSLFNSDLQKKIIEEVKGRLASNPDSEEAEKILHFLMEEAEYKKDHESVESMGLVRDWCLQRSGQAKIQKTLSHLLRIKPDRQLIRESELQLKIHGYSTDSGFVLVSLLNALKDKSQRKFWYDDWMENADESIHDGWVIATYLGATNCSRRAFNDAKIAIQYGAKGRGEIFFVLFRFLNRKPVNRFLYRTLRRHLDRSVIQDFLFSLLVCHYKTPPREIRKLGLKALNYATGSRKLEFIEQLTLISNDSTLVKSSLDLVYKHPDTPFAFKLMTNMASNGNEEAKEWLVEWMKTALISQKVDAVVALIDSSNESKYFEIAKELYDQVAEMDYGLRRNRLARLLAYLIHNSKDKKYIEAGERLTKDTNNFAYKSRLVRVLESHTASA